MTRQSAARLLLIEWLAIVGLCAPIVLIQSMAGAFGPDSDVVWAWLLSSITAPFSIVVTVVFSDTKAAWKKAQASTFRLLSAAIGSFAFGAALFGVLLLEPLTTARNFELFQATTPLFALAQIVVVAAVSSVVFEAR